MIQIVHILRCLDCDFIAKKKNSLYQHELRVHVFPPSPPSYSTRATRKLLLSSHQNHCPPIQHTRLLSTRSVRAGSTVCNQGVALTLHTTTIFSSIGNTPMLLLQHHSPTHHNRPSIIWKQRTIFTVWHLIAMPLSLGMSPLGSIGKPYIGRSIPTVHLQDTGKQKARSSAWSQDVRLF